MSTREDRELRVESGGKEATRRNNEKQEKETLFKDVLNKILCESVRNVPMDSEAYRVIVLGQCI